MKVVNLWIKSLVRHPDNVRSAKETQKAEVADLMESIKVHGVLQPLVVMPGPKSGEHTVLAGHRRLAALKFMKREKAPCVALNVKDDAQAISILLAENAQHEAPHPVREAEGIARLLAEYAEKEKPYDLIAAQLGKSANWVRRRARLTNLHPKWVKAIDKGEKQLDELPVGHLELLAAFDHPVQEQMLREVTSTLMYEGVPTRSMWGDWLRDSTSVLGSNVRWDLNDPDVIPDAPACMECPLRESAQGDLFVGASDAENDRCLRTSCFNAKTQAARLTMINEALKKHDDLELTTNVVGVADSLPEEVAVHNTFDRTPLAKTKGGVPTLNLETGKVTWTGKASAKSQKPSQGGGTKRTTAAGAPAPTPLAERRAAHKKRRVVRALTVAKATIEGHKRATIGHKTVDKKTGRQQAITVDAPEGSIPTLVSVLHAIIRLGSDIVHRMPPQSSTGGFADPKEDCGIIDDSTHTKLWCAVRGRLATDCNIFGGMTAKAAGERAKAVAEVLVGMGLSWEKDFWDPACEALPEPASWAKLNADGTAKKAKGKGGAKKKATAKKK